MINVFDIKESLLRISPYIKRTPLIGSSFLNDQLGHEIIFKAESLQVTGAFKIRGVLNTILSLKEQNNLPRKIIAYSSGNHAQAIAWVGREFGIETEVYMPNFTSSIKIKSAKEYGANVITTRTRTEAERKSFLAGQEEGAYYLAPSDNDKVIAGAGTLCYEALQDISTIPDAVFSAIGGGGLVSGSYVAAKSFSSKIKVFAAEPLMANDAARSFRNKKIFRFAESPDTIAEGAKTLGLSERTFNYIQQVDDVIEVEEEDIIYWTAWIPYLLNIGCEPTAGLAMAAAFNWLKTQKKSCRVLILLSGGNVDQQSLKKIWKTDHLARTPSL